METKSPETRGSRAARAGTNIPASPRSCAKAIDWSSRVLPPELGPVTITTEPACADVDVAGHRRALLAEQERVEERA